MLKFSVCKVWLYGQYSMHPIHICWFRFLIMKCIREILSRFWIKSSFCKKLHVCPVIFQQLHRKILIADDKHAKMLLPLIGTRTSACSLSSYWCICHNSARAEGVSPLCTKAQWSTWRIWHLNLSSLRYISKLQMSNEIATWLEQ